MSFGGGGGDPQMRVTNYWMSIHMAFCQGRVDALRALYFREKLGWAGKVTEGQNFVIDSRELFGGIRKEGGVAGFVFYQPGSYGQIMDANVCAKYGRTQETMTSYRGLCHAMFSSAFIAGHTFDEDYLNQPEHPGFYWSSNSPYVPPVWATVTRFPEDWYLEKVAVPRSAATPAVDPGPIIAETWDVADYPEGDLQPYTDFALPDSGGYDAGHGVWTKTMGKARVTAKRFSDLTGTRSLKLFDEFDGNGIAGEASRAGAYYDVATLGEDPNAPLSFNVTIEGGGDPSNAKYRFVIMQANKGGSASEADQIAYSMPPDAADITEVYNSGWLAIQDFTTNTLDFSFGPFQGDYLSFVITGGAPFNTSTEFSQFTFEAVAEPDFLDANPIHIIRECLVSANFGAGLPESLIDDANFRACADTLYDEGFGLSLMWVAQTPIKDFVQDILDHIQATLFLHPRTGLFTIRLIRDDYDPATLPLLDPSNSFVSSFLRQSGGESTNEIIVTWTNPENELEETVSGQNLGGIVAANGQIRSDKRNYHGVRYRGLAVELLSRDLATASNPLATVEATASNKFWDLTPGEPVRLTSPKDNAVELVCRVMDVRQARKGNPGIGLRLVEDVFTRRKPKVSVPPDSGWEPQTSQPVNVEEAYLFSLPYFLMVNFLSSTLTTGAEHPDVFAGVLGTSLLPDALGFDLWGEVTDAAGNVTWASLGERPLTARGVLANPLALEAGSSIPAADLGTLSRGQGPRAGGIMLLGDGTDEATVEMVLLQSFDGTSWTVARGVLDTVPRAWPAGTPCWFLGPDSKLSGNRVRAVGEVVDYKLRLRTSLGLLPLAQTITHSETLTDRLYLPARPANVQVNGAGIEAGYVNVEGLNPVPVTWANRNRITEDAVVLSWGDAGVTPETGQTTKLVVVDDETETVLDTISGLAGGTHDIPAASFGAASRVRIQFWAERDGLESLQAAEIPVIVEGGFGHDFGLNFGGT